MQIKTKFISATIVALTFVLPAHAAVNANIDTNGDGAISAEEFVLFSGERDMRQRDADKNGVFSTQEWVGKGGGDYWKVSMKRFDADGDGVLTATEVVDVYLWTFKNRDKNKDGQLTGDEIPKGMMTAESIAQKENLKTSKAQKKTKAFTEESEK